jgi:hypothetical protein
MSSIRDKQYWKLRQLSKQMSGVLSSHINGLTHAKEIIPVQNSVRMLSSEFQKLEREFDSLWRIYGFKSMVMDKRRRCSTRKGNQNFTRVIRRAKKRHERQVAIHASLLELEV